MKTSYSNSLKILCFLALNSLITGCENDDAGKGIYQRLAEISCKRILKNPRIPQEKKDLAKKILGNWSNAILDFDPVLVDAAYRILRRDGDIELELIFSDEDEDVVGIGVKETHILEDGNAIEIVEEYPVFAPAPLGANTHTPFSIRKENERKDEDAWAAYKKNPTTNHHNHPDLWISVPDPPKITVEIWLYDTAGNRSNAVRLESGDLDFRY